MNHKQRARGIVGGAMPPVIIGRSIKTKRTSHIDVSGWHAEMTKAVARGLRQCERDAHNDAIRAAARRAHNYLLERFVGAIGPKDALAVAGEVLALEQKGRRPRKERA
jgi:hypothetical protein